MAVRSLIYARLSLTIPERVPFVSRGITRTAVLDIRMPQGRDAGRADAE
jgi:hypothetical protein